MPERVRALEQAVQELERVRLRVMELELELELELEVNWSGYSGRSKEVVWMHAGACAGVGASTGA